jgi:hypothetical protein
MDSVDDHRLIKAQAYRLFSGGTALPKAKREVAEHTMPDRDWYCILLHIDTRRLMFLVNRRDTLPLIHCILQATDRVPIVFK